MKHSNIIQAQQVIKAIVDNNIQHLVISPGSRNAPVIIESHAYPNLNKYNIVDERSAGFFALGLALKTKQAVALTCTSGSALLNYYPALVEAYYSNIPLVILSADRPDRLINIGDGQTINQHNVYQNHIEYSVTLSESNYTQNFSDLKLGFEVLLNKKRPIHINIPFSEPLYNKSNLLINDIFSVKKTNDNIWLDETPWNDNEMEHFAKIWNSSDKKMILVGGKQPDELLQIQLEHLTKDPSVIILTEATANVYHHKFINHIDRLIFPWNNETFKTYKPNILITIGGHIVSKKIKQLLRQIPPSHHWHISRHQRLDTYHCLTKYFNISPTLFFSQLFFKTIKKDSSYRDLFLNQNKHREIQQKKYLDKIPFSDLKAYDLIQQHLPENCHLHFSNSSAIRYAQFFCWKSKHIHCNRGTSGIDGCTSTAVGFACTTSSPTLLITGDLSFFYDNNALWNNYIPKNFRVIIINNSGGGIFKFISGPSQSNVLNDFETPHNLNAFYLCKMHQFEYHSAKNIKELNNIWKEFYNPSEQPKLLEIFTPKNKNAVILKLYFKTMSNKVI